MPDSDKKNIDKPLVEAMRKGYVTFHEKIASGSCTLAELGIHYYFMMTLYRDVKDLMMDANN
jgi:hypothetical protein